MRIIKLHRRYVLYHRGYTYACVFDHKFRSYDAISIIYKCEGVQSNNFIFSRGDGQTTIGFNKKSTETMMRLSLDSAGKMSH